MSDGSTLSGTTELTRVKFVADYGTMDISMRYVKTVTFSDDHETVKIIMANGDTLNGSLDLPDFSMKSLIGTVKVPLAHLKKLTIKGEATEK